MSSFVESRNCSTSNRLNTYSVCFLETATRPVPRYGPMHKCGVIVSRDVKHLRQRGAPGLSMVSQVQWELVKCEWVSDPNWRWDKTTFCRLLIIESHHCTCFLPDCHTPHEQRVCVSALRTQAMFDKCFCMWMLYQAHSFIRCNNMLLVCLLLACVGPWTGVVWCSQLLSSAFVVANV